MDLDTDRNDSAVASDHGDGARSALLSAFDKAAVDFLTVEGGEGAL